MTTEKTPPVPHHVEQTVATIAALHAAHYREARALQKAVSRATSGVAQPASLLHGGLEWRVGALMRYLFLKRRGGIWPARTRAFG